MRAGAGEAIFPIFPSKLTAGCLSTALEASSVSTVLPPRVGKGGRGEGGMGTRVAVAVAVALLVAMPLTVALRMAEAGVRVREGGRVRDTVVDQVPPRLREGLPERVRLPVTDVVEVRLEERKDEEVRDTEGERLEERRAEKVRDTEGERDTVPVAREVGVGAMVGGGRQYPRPGRHVSPSPCTTVHLPTPLPHVPDTPPGPTFRSTLPSNM